MFGFFLIASAAVRGLNTTERDRSHAGRGALEARGERLPRTAGDTSGACSWRIMPIRGGAAR